MKRELKFRAWNDNAKEMVYQSDSYSSLSLGKLLDGYSIVMQFTGLKDKTGKELYEGDLITESVNSCKWIYEIRSCEEFGINLFKVLRYRNFDTDENGDLVFGDYWMDTVDSQLRKGKYSIVIGNIYENPELLKAGHFKHV